MKFPSVVLCPWSVFRVMTAPIGDPMRTVSEHRGAYRPDVDGLRAIAVLLVVAFHLGVSSVPGGFIGVDVFFVISGYLITQIITRELEAGRFSFAGFYERRIRRIFPALLVMLAAVLALGPFLLVPGDYKVAGWSALYAAASLSNIYFLFNTGYFDAAAESLPLLHTWSLAVEEQFYLAWPLLLALTARVFGARRITFVLTCAVAFTLSFAWSVQTVPVDPKAAFYLPHLRAWELAAGGLVAVLPGSLWRARPLVLLLFSGAGLIAIVASALLLTKAHPFPGWSAAPAVVGTALLLAPWTSVSHVQRLLATSPLVGIGKISYSLYLWHWPVIVLFQHYNLDRAPTFWQQCGLIALIFPLAWLSWRFVEQPFRAAAHRPRVNIPVGLAASVAVAVVAFSIVRAEGFPARVPPSAQGLGSLDEMWAWSCPQQVDIPELGGKQCVIGADWHTAKLRGVLWGDSHKEHFAPLLDRPAKEIGLALIEYQNCMPLVGNDALKRFFPSNPTYTEDCSKVRKPVLDYVKNNPLDLFVLAASWVFYPPSLYSNTPSERSEKHGLQLMKAEFGRLLAQIDQPNLQTLIIGDVPSRYPYFSSACLFGDRSIILRPTCPPEVFGIPARSLESGQAATTQALREVGRENPKLSVLIAQDALCDGSRCITSVDGEFIYRDVAHLRRNMSENGKNKLSEILGLKSALLRALESRAPID